MGHQVMDGMACVPQIVRFPGHGQGSNAPATACLGEYKPFVFKVSPFNGSKAFSISVVVDPVCFSSPRPKTNLHSWYGTVTGRNAVARECRLCPRRVTRQRRHTEVRVELTQDGQARKNLPTPSNTTSMQRSWVVVCLSHLPLSRSSYTKNSLADRDAG